MHFTLQSQGFGMKLGLAASQVGVYQRIALVEGTVCINPEWKSGSQVISSTEGCYSVEEGASPFVVTRDKYGWARYQNAQGEWQEEKLNGRKAIVYQHELDHLNGILCSDKGVRSP